MNAIDVAALALAAMLAGAGALVLIAARFRSHGGRAGAMGRLSTTTMAVVSLALLVGAHQAAAGPLGWTPRLPGYFVAIVLIVIVGLSIYLDAHLAHENDEGES